MQVLYYVEALPWVWGALAIVVIFVTVAACGVLLVRSLIDHKRLRSHHDVAGFVFTNLGVLYAVLLGFIVVNVQQRFDRIIDTAEIEAGYLAQLYEDAAIFPDANRASIRSALKDYGRLIIDHEWSSMAKGISVPVSNPTVQKLWQAYYAVEPSTKRMEIWYAESITKLNDLMHTRLTRILAGRASLGSEIWSLLILGGVVMVTFICFFSVEHTFSHILMAAVLAATTAFLLFLIYSLDSAFSGEVSIGPEPFIKVIQLFS